MSSIASVFMFFFFNDTATTEIYTLSLHDALPICPYFAWERPIGSRQSWTEHASCQRNSLMSRLTQRILWRASVNWKDRKSTRLNSSHLVISYAVFCLKKKKTTIAESPARPRTAHR